MSADEPSPSNPSLPLPVPAQPQWSSISGAGAPRTAAPWAKKGNTDIAEASEPRSATNTESGTHYMVPEKKISSQSDLDRFLVSDAHSKYRRFVAILSDSVKGVAYDTETSPMGSGSDPSQLSPSQQRTLPLREMLRSMECWLDEFPPIKESMRFGNRAFQQFHRKLVQTSRSLLTEALPSEFHGAIIELGPYLHDSFGNPTRIDYGTGHEASFIAFLLCLREIGYLKDEDAQIIVLTVFRQYIHLMRMLQRQYILEPAGSRGVWGLDDYHFLPFLFGSSQLQLQDKVTPANVIEPAIVKEVANRYFYVDAIGVIMEMKRGAPLGECAPLLNDITLVPSWAKVNSGLQKMYDAEVLSKLPVIQHFLFGSILTMLKQNQS